MPSPARVPRAAAAALALLVLAAAGGGAAEEFMFQFVLDQSAGLGSATYNDVAKTLSFSVTYSVFSGPPTGASINAATGEPFNGITGPAIKVPDFPDTITGLYNGVVDLTQDASFDFNFLNFAGGTAEDATAALVAALQESKAYFTIHTNDYPLGEVSGFFCPPGSNPDGSDSCTGPNLGVTNDPIITGFDGKRFHFDEVGDFTLVGESDGWKVDTTFAGAEVAFEGVPMEKSWTRAVRVISPKGDMVTCALPAIQPLSVKVQMSAVSGGKKSTVTDEVQLGDMKAEPVWTTDGLSDPNRHIIGCRIHTPKLVLTVYQVSGADQAAAHPEEAWAAPYTWLNSAFKVLQPLAEPVTGIMGATYPSSHTSAGAADRAASVDGEVERRPARSLLSVGGEDAAPFRPLAGGVQHGAQH